MEHGMKVGIIDDAAIGEAIRNKRKKVTSGFDGLTIEFETDLNLQKDMTVYATFSVPKSDKLPNGRVGQDFEIIGTAINGNKIACIAKEVGYWASLISKRTDIDIRNMVGVEVTLVMDEEYLSRLQTSKRYC